VIIMPACLIFGPAGNELGGCAQWCDDDDDLARGHGGFVVELDSEPPHILADFRPCPRCGGPLAGPAGTCDLTDRHDGRPYDATRRGDLPWGEGVPGAS
jgi:hypothetical protein